MPRSGLALLAILTVAPVAFAQAPLPPAGQPLPGTPVARVPVPGGEVPVGLPPAAPVVDKELLAHLMGWERTMKGAANFYTDCKLKRTNLLLGKETYYSGTIMCMKPNLARLRLDKLPVAGAPANPNDYTAYICTGQAVYEYEGTAKQVTEIKLKNGGVGDNLLLEFMSGTLTADQALKRFAMKTLKVDQNYIFLEIRPLPGSKETADFQTMTLVLFQPNIPQMGNMAYLPRTVVIRKGNGQEEEVWDFPLPKANLPKDQVKPEYFLPIPVASLPAGWKVQQAPQQPAGPGPVQPDPRVVRPMSP